MAELGTLALALLLMAAAGVLAVRLALPPALGYVAAGVAGAAAAPGLLPEHGIHLLAEIGVLALLFFIGLELNLKRLRTALRTTAATVPFAIGLSTVAVAVGVRFLGWSFVHSLALGLAIAVSSTLFGERLTAAPGVTQRARDRVLGVLISEDVAAGGIIALMVVMGGEATWFGPVEAIGRLLFFLILLTAGAILLVPRILDEMARRHVPELLVLWASGLVALAAYLGYLAGSPELGAFVAGVAAAEAGSRYVVRNALSGIRDLASAVFFLASGLAVEVWTLVDVLPVILLVAVLSLVGKLLIHLPAALAAGLPLRDAVHAAAALGTVGEFSLILTTIAIANGIAPPGMRGIVVGSMIVLLPVAALLMRTGDAAERGFARLPAKARKPLLWLVRTSRRTTSQRRDAAWVGHARLRAANGVLLAAWLLLAVWLRPRIQPYLEGSVVPAAALAWGLTVGVAIPLLVGTYRAYSRLVWDLVGLREGEREGAGRVRARFVDALVALGFVLALVIATLRFPQTLPVLAVGTVVALIVAAVAWRQLSRFHHAMEATLGRVLGHDPTSAALLDQIMDRYPWGVKFAAVVVPPGSPVAGRTLLGSRLAPLSGAMVAVLQRGKREIVNPRPEETVRTGDTLVLLGDAHQLARAEALIVSHGDAIRMTAQSSTAGVHEIEVKDVSPWAGAKMRDTQIREATGTLVIGIWAQGEKHPQPYKGDTVLRPGDKLILLGTPLQIQRASLLAAGIPRASPD